MSELYDVALYASSFLVGKTPRAERIHLYCDTFQTEDEKHVVLWCAACNCIEPNPCFGNNDQVH